MKIVVILMVMCSTVTGNKCQPIATPQVEFKDMYECTVYGYSYSEQVILELGAEFINNYGAYTKFACEKKEIV
jgi:hypothetical protein